jgi:formamidopyrimidine-DNA glycosylase
LKETAEKEQEEAINPPPLKRRKSSTVSPRPDWPPRWWKFVLILDDGTQISFADCRRLGRVFLHQGPNPKDHTAIKKLGFDALLSVPNQADFDALVARRSLPLKALLLNQAFAAGVGNWIADEVLYQARFHPERRANTLSKDELVTLRDKIIYIVKTAVELKTQSKRLPDDWLFHRRWSKVAAKKETQKTVEGHEIAFATVGGRTSAYVPALQPAPEGFVNDADGSGGKKKKVKKEKKSTEGKKQKKAKKNANSDDEEEMSIVDDEDSDEAPAPISRRSSSSRLSRQSSKKSLKEESSADEDQKSAEESSDDDFVSTKSKKSKKRKSDDSEEDNAPNKKTTKSPARKKSKLADVKQEKEIKDELAESRPAPAKRKRSQIEADSDEKPKFARRKSSTTKPKKEPGEGH